MFEIPSWQRMRRCNLAFFAMLLSGSFSALAVDTTGQTLVDNVLSNGIVVSPEADEARVRAALGTPNRSESKEVLNQYSGKSDRAVFLFYEGLSILVFTFTDPQHGWSKVSQVRVWNPKWQLPGGLKIGMQASAVAQRFGKPHISENSGRTWVYFPSNEESHLQLRVEFMDEVLKEVVWSYLP